MKKYIQTSIKQRLILILFGLILGIALLEVILRTGGFVLTSLQEQANRLSLEEKGECVIMCIGESTTAGGYPRQLESILNNSKLGISFSVLDKGIQGTNSAFIVSQLEENINEYQPNIIIVMMGTNDSPQTVVYENTSGVKIKLFLQDFRVYKLVRLLQEHIIYKINEIINGQENPGEWGIATTKDEDRKTAKTVEEDLTQDELEQELQNCEDKLALKPNNTEILFKVGICYFKLGRHFEAEREFKKLLKIEPKSSRAYVELENIYLEHDRWGDISELTDGDNAKIDPELDEKRYEKYIELARAHYWKHNYKIVGLLCRIAIGILPDDDRAYAELGRVDFVTRIRPKEAEEMCEKAIEINPRNALALNQLGSIYKARGDWRGAAKMYKKALKLPPQDNSSFGNLLTLYLQKQEFGELEKICLDTIKHNPDNSPALSALALCYEGQGKGGLAENYFNKAKEARSKYFNPTTAKNYQRLQEIVTANGIQLVCMQYAMRNLEDLKRLLPDHKGIIFIDNESIFKEAVKRKGYSTYFIDSFRGDFGHCSEKGKWLMAENIAKIILKEVFGTSSEK
ncbi:MAG: tetratricopeptide repeat protein [Candidatus Hydrogenedentes bacterium]|nr:tetratricopeptide repeat protein [Candidatus Hydrogenedentota bacterium]